MLLLNLLFSVYFTVVTSVRGIGGGFFDKKSSGVPDEQYDEELYQLILHQETTAQDLREIFSEIHVSSSTVY